MTYANDLPILDADSHLMEPLDWLAGYAEPDVRAKLLQLDVSAGGDRATHDLVRDCWARRDDPEATAKLAADVVGGPKGYFAFGSMDPVERVAALDQLGYVGQLVFSTFAPNQFNAGPGRRAVTGGDLDLDLDLVYGGARAHNRGIVDFCAGDRRLRPVGFVPLDDPERSIACLNEALDLGIAAAWVPHGVPADKSPTHPDFDGLWARLAEARIPMLFHFGGNGGTQMARSYHNNGRDPGKDFVGGGESVRSKDFLNIFHDAENLLACLVLDGTFEQFPELRCGVIELGAGWVPNLLRSLDHAVRAFGRNEPELAKLRLTPSDYIRRQVRFTPWHFEDVGELTLSCGPDLFLFSSDWPHPEGGRDPLAEFRSSLDSSEIGPAARHRFYYQNLADLLGAPA